MLYISSRSKTESFTAHRTLCSDRAPDGGAFLPYRVPSMDRKELQTLCSNPFSDIVAKVLNMFFSCKLSSWDVEMCIGRTPVRLNEIPFRVLVTECFHNPEGEYAYIESYLYRKLVGNDAYEKPTQWPRVAIRIAVLFAVHGMLPGSACKGYDISVDCGDFTAPLAAWYAKAMGLPIRKIICSCNEGSAIWDLIQKGEINTGSPILGAKHMDSDIACSAALESVIHHTIGAEAAIRFADTCKQKGIYRIAEEDFEAFSSSFFSSVVGKNRIGNLIRNIYFSVDCCLTDRSGAAYGGLQDYRARTGESGVALILADFNPAFCVREISAVAGIPEQEILNSFRS